ncbi:MAG: 3-isopropylmalate dehydratase [Nitrospinaceae bacterium]|nr:3-isopropylmalate dehydratase [Nitrospinaceae bacterium]
MTMKGKVHRFGDNVSTDVHLSVKYRSPDTSLEDLKKDAFKEIAPAFSSSVQKGDVLVAGDNFGLISSRADAAVVLRELGISCVLAKSFGHMFYRNALNMGLPVVECDTDAITADDDIEVDLEAGTVRVGDEEIPFSPFPPSVLHMVDAGGLIPFLKTEGGYPA